ncbi:MAG: FecR domain-containing protein [Rhizobiaceae bacterium]
MITLRGKNTVRRRHSLLSLTAATALLMMTGVGQTFAAPKIGTTSSVQGSAFVLTEGARRKAQVRDSIQLNDEVQTKDDSALQIMLLDQTIFTVGQNCSIIIDEFVYDPNTSVGDLSAQVLSGAFRYMTGQIGRANPINASINTPSATIGIRGTFFEGIVGEDAVALAKLGGIDTSNADLSKASITILRGAGPGANSLDKHGSISVTSAGVTKTILEPGYAIFSPGPGLPPIGPFPMTEDMREYLDFFLRSTPNGPSENPVEVSTGSQESGQHQFENDTNGDDPELDDGGDEGTEDDLPEDREDEDEDEYPCYECVSEGDED